MNILTLDLGTTTGWAVQSGAHITSGAKEFKPDRFEGGGMRYLKFKGWLSTMKDQSGGFDAVFFEEVRRHAGTTAAHVYGGFLAHLTAWCETEKIPYQGIPVATIKKHATGKGNTKKEGMIAAMVAKGHAPADDNEADALAILYYAKDLKLVTPNDAPPVFPAQAEGTVWDGPRAPNMRKRVITSNDATLAPRTRVRLTKIRCQCDRKPFRSRSDVSPGFDSRGKSVWFCDACIPY